MDWTCKDCGETAPVADFERSGGHPRCPNCNGMEVGVPTFRLEWGTDDVVESVSTHKTLEEALDAARSGAGLVEEQLAALAKRINPVGQTVPEGESPYHFSQSNAHDATFWIGITVEVSR